MLVYLTASQKRFQKAILPGRRNKIFMPILASDYTLILALLYPIIKIRELFRSRFAHTDLRRVFNVKNRMVKSQTPKLETCFNIFQFRLLNTPLGLLCLVRRNLKKNPYKKYPLLEYID